MKTRKPNYLAIEGIVAVLLVAFLFVADSAYVSGLLAKGTALGLSALLLFTASIAVVGLVIDLSIAGFCMVYSRMINR